MKTGKQLVMLLLTLVLLIGLAPMVTTAAEPPVVQNEGFIEPAGTVGLLQDLTPKYGSNGKFLAPIEPPIEGSIAISNREELIQIGNNPAFPLSGSYHLTADIDLNPALYGDTEWVPIGNRAYPFTGTFDGQGRVIRNLTITENHEDNGLFGHSASATIKNIGLDGTYINVSSSYAGGICGYSSSSGSITNCYNTGSVTSSSPSRSLLHHHRRPRRVPGLHSPVINNRQSHCEDLFFRRQPPPVPTITDAIQPPPIQFLIN